VLSKTPHALAVGLMLVLEHPSKNLLHYDGFLLLDQG